MFRHFASVLFFVVSVVSSESAPLLTTGTYNQLYTNAYVDSTTEIDWKCTQVHVTVHDDNHGVRVVYHKTAQLHGGPQTVKTPTFAGRLIGGTLTSNASEWDLHSYNPETLVLTGTTNPSMYVWTRSTSSSESESESESESDSGNSGEPADIPRLMVFVTKLGLRAPLRLVPTYNDTACNATATATATPTPTPLTH